MMGDTIATTGWESGAADRLSDVLDGIFRQFEHQLAGLGGLVKPQPNEGISTARTYKPFYY